MANFSALKTAIQNAIKQNGNEEITGDVLQQILLSVVNTMGDGAINTIEQNLSQETQARQNGDNTLQSNINAEALARGNADTQLQNAINAIKANIDNGYVYAGIATPSSTPVSGKVFYIATAAGTYTNFGGQVLTQGINILRFNGSAWSSQQLIGIDDVPTAGSNKFVKSGGVQNELALGAVYDVSAKNPTAGPNNDGKWESLSALLSDANLNTLIPTAYRKGGMSIKYVQTNDNKYVSYRLMATSFSTTESDWQGVKNEPIFGSKSLIDGDGIAKSLARINSLGVIGQTLDGFINMNTGIISHPSGDYKILLCPVVESKLYKYYSGVSGVVNGACYEFYNALLEPVGSPVGIASVGWINNITVPSGAKYFGANIKVKNTWPQSQTDECSLVEITKCFEFLDSVENTFAEKVSVLSDSEEQKKRISRSLFESGFAFTTKLGITDKYYLGWIAATGGIAYNSSGNYKVIVAKVSAGKTYKLYVSGNNSAANDCGNYSFYSNNELTSGNAISPTTSVQKNVWHTLTAPVGAVYFAVCLEFNGTGDINDCCFIEYNKYQQLINANINTVTTYQNSVKPVFGFVSKNIYNGSTVLGWLSPATGNLVDTSAQGEKYVTTDYIPVKPNTYYSLADRGQSQQQSMGYVAAVGYSQDKGTNYVLLKKDGTVPSGSSPFFLYNGDSIVNNGVFKTDSNTYWVRFTIRFNDYPSQDWTKIMLEEIGDYYDETFEPSEYQPYDSKPYINSESLPKSVSILKDKKIAYNGDSFCESRLSGFANNGGGYPVLIAKATGCTFENRAISGGILSTGTASYNPGRKICLDVENMAQDADLICFEGGINDWSANVPLGTFSKTDYTSTYDESTITGALESIFRQAINRWVGKPICFIICHKISVINEQFAAGTFWDVHDRMVEVCNKWSIPYYDAFLHSGLNGMIAAQNNAFLNGGANTHPDGWHPDKGGYEKYYVPQLIKLFESLLQVNS